MMITLVLCLLFFIGHLALRTHGQALAFLVIGAGVQLATAAIPAPDTAQETPADTTTLILVCIFSVLGYIAWRASRSHMEIAPFGKTRLLIFLGWFANGVLFSFILWLTGMISIPA